MAWGGMAGANLQQLTSDIIGHFRSKKDMRKYWQMYEKRYQTTVNDLRAAGLNPMLAYGGAGTPALGAPDPMGGVSAPEVMSGVEREQRLAEKARLEAGTQLDQAAAKRQDQDALTSKAQEDHLRQEQATSSAQEKVLTMEIGKKAAETLEANARAELLRLDAQKSRFELPGSEAKAKFWSVVNRMTEGGSRAAAETTPERLHDNVGGFLDWLFPGRKAPGGRGAHGAQRKP